MAVWLSFRQVDLGALLELRDRVLTPGHPGRPVTWSYDTSATHYGMFVDDQLIGCVSTTHQETPKGLPALPVVKPYHLHSMAVEPDSQGRGVGRAMLVEVTAAVAAEGGDLIWATARPSAVRFYKRCGFEAGDETRVAPTQALMQYVWLLIP